MRCKLLFLVFTLALLAGSAALAQSGALPYPGEGEMPFRLPQRSWCYQQLPPARN